MSTYGLWEFIRRFITGIIDVWVFLFLSEFEHEVYIFQSLLYHSLGHLGHIEDYLG